MAPRLKKSTVPALRAVSPTVAGRCKPMRVEKPQTKRVHKVRQGRKPKLSASQRRKLVRLYIFTNLPWKTISDLVLHYGHIDIKIRALQYILEGILGAQYSQLRPKGMTGMKKRIDQFRSCKNTERTETHVLESAEMAPSPIGIVVSQTTKVNVRHSPRPLVHTGSVGTKPGPVRVHVDEDDNFFLKCFDSFNDGRGADEAGNSVFDHSPRLFPNDDTITAFEWTSSIASSPVCRTDYAPVRFPAPVSQDRVDLVQQTSESRWPTGHDTSTRVGGNSANTRTHHSRQINNPDRLWNDNGSLDRPSSIGAKVSPLSEPTCKAASFKMEAETKERLDTQPLRSFGNLNPDDSPENSSPSSAQGPYIHVAGESSTADVTTLIDGFAAYNLEGKGMIKDVVTTFSDSSSSRSRRSSKSRGSSSDETPLMQIIRSSLSEDEEIEEITSADSDFDAKNRGGETALHLAVKLGKVSATRALLDHGADPHVADRQGRGVLAVAKWFKRRARDDEDLCARITACMALAIDAGATAEPVPVQVHNRSTHPRDTDRRYKTQDPRYHV